jgi:alkanesulfonate monooxygenase SsuD/methylene tetrahydromethanopterin reductase-like flavin-dependent oxidoreductase (luciferase family)
MSQSQSFRLGLMTHVEGAGDAGHIYRETLELFVAADQLGFDVAWVAQHHFKDVAGRLPSPFPFLAAASQCTRRVRLGACVVVLPLELPLRVAEDAAVVDALSGGRLELGIGSGGDPAEFQAFGVDVARRHELTTQGLSTLQRALRGESLGEHGQHLEPPAPSLADRLWQAALSMRGAQYVAHQGVGMLLSRAQRENGQPTDRVQVPLAEAYLEAWDGRAAQAHVAKPRIGLSRGIYPAPDRRVALAELREGVLRTAAGMIRQGQLPAGMPLEHYCDELNVLYGHPDEVAARLMADRMLPYATDLILQFNPGNPPLARAISMLEQVAAHIAPALGWRPSVND